MSVNKLASITNTLKASYPATQEWIDSDFDWIRGIPPASKGVIGRYSATALLQGAGLTVTAYKYELRINAQGVLVRLAMKWDGNFLKFQNIRDVQFDHLLCLGIYPKAAYGWLVPKGEIWKDKAIRSDRTGVTRQHKGADAWISVDPRQPPSWIQPYGGTLDEMLSVARHAL